MPLYSYKTFRPELPTDGSAWIAPSADLVGQVIVGETVSIWFGAVIRADNTPIQIGARSNVQEGSVLHSDPGFPLSIGADVTIGHRAVLHGCRVGDRTLIGMGAIILNGAEIGDDCIVGAGALVTQGKQFPPHSLITGSPATVRRTLSAEELKELTASAAEYATKAGLYSVDLELLA